jgi:hypothetical protein
MIDIQDTPPLDDTLTPHSTMEPPTPPLPPSTPNLVGIARPFDDLIAVIRVALAPGTPIEVRTAGAAACRALLTELEPPVAQALAAPPAPIAATSPLAMLLARLAAMPREQLTGMVSQLAAMPRAQLFDVLLSHLRGALPPGAQTRATTSPRFHLIAIPQPRPPDRGA